MKNCRTLALCDMSAPTLALVSLLCSTEKHSRQYISHVLSPSVSATETEFGKNWAFLKIYFVLIT